MIDETKHQVDEYHSDIDALLMRIVLGSTTTEVGLTRRLADIAEEHHKLYSEVKVNLALRFTQNMREGVYTEERIASIAPALRSHLGLDNESHG